MPMCLLTEKIFTDYAVFLASYKHPAEQLTFTEVAKKINVTYAHTHKIGRYLVANNFLKLILIRRSKYYILTKKGILYNKCLREIVNEQKT